MAKVGPAIVRLDRRQGPLAEADVASCLVHADGFLNVPVIVKGDLLVRGYTPELYHEALSDLHG